MGKKIANYRFFPMLFKWEIEGSDADSKQPILATMFLAQTYHLSTARRVKLELGNIERPNGHNQGLEMCNY